MSGGPIVACMPTLAAATVPVHGVRTAAEAHHEIEQAGKQQQCQQPCHELSPLGDVTSDRRSTIRDVSGVGAPLGRIVAASRMRINLR
jgi:hypothetical protein